MASSTTEKTFKVTVTGNAAAEGKKVASSSREAAEQIAKYDARVKSLSGDLRRLRGTSEEVKNAKAALKKEIDSARNASSQLVLQLQREGTSYDKASKAAERYKASRGLLGRAKDAVGGAVGSAREAGSRIVGAARSARGDTKGFDGFKKALGGATGEAKALVAEAQVGEAALSALGAAGSAAATGVAAVGAAAVVAGAAIVAATAGIIAFALKSSDAAAAQRRHAMALGWSEQSASNFNDQVQDLAGKVSLGTDELGAMSLELSKTRLSGKAAVDTMNAVAQATSAVDASAGNKLKEIITRGQNTGRLFLGRRELQGTGIDFDDVAKEYAAGTRKSLGAARAELMSGRAPLERGAEAIRKATEKKFGKLNVANAFSLANAPKKFGDALKNLSSGVDLSPLSQQLAKVYDTLKPEAPLGAAIKTMVETLGTGFVDVASKAVPAAIEGFKWMMVWALKLGTRYYELKKQVKDAFAIEGFVGAGKAIVSGLVKGIVGSSGEAIDAVRNMGAEALKGFKDVLGIHSPSKVFAEFGQHTTAGYVQGIERGDAQAQRAVEGMIDMPSARGASAPAPPATGSSGPAKVELHVHIDAGNADAKELQSDSFLAGLTKVCVDALQTVGLEVAT